MKSFLIGFIGFTLVCGVALSMTAHSRSSRVKEIVAVENDLKQQAEKSAAYVREVARQLENARPGDSIQLKNRLELTVVENSDHLIVSGSDGVHFEICSGLSDFAEEVNRVTKAKSMVHGK